MKKNNRKRNAKTFVLIAVLVLAIGYAIITTSIIVIKKYPDDIKIYPGHGDITNLGYEKENNYFLK